MYISTHESSALDSFQLVSAAPGSMPDAVDFQGALTSNAPCTVAKAYADARKLDLAHPPELDASDHWYRCTLPALPPADRHVLVFEGLAGIADVWLDGAPLLHSENMFVEERVTLPASAREGSVLTLCFRALKKKLAERRPRPRWRTRIVEQQQLRWIRTSLIGRTGGFCPLVPVLGPYRPVRIEAQRDLAVRTCSLTPSYHDGVAELQIALELETLGSDGPKSARLWLEGAAGHGQLDLSADFRGTLLVSDAKPWFPHTHGAQPLSQARVVVQLASGRTVELALGTVGFRSIRVDRDTDGLGFGLRINDVAVFCRGACWTTDDLLTLGSARLRETLELVRDAGMNMLRVPGITSYESDAFHALCDELGILVFQDFMFANMDYPIADPTFAKEVERELRSVLTRIGMRPSTAVLCGGSEVEQQISMLGLPKDQWTSPLFEDVMPRAIEQLAKGVPYVTSSPSGGTLPFHVNAGVSHYYGVGAYHRPLEDARRSRVRFTSECLAFANLPCQATIESFMGDLEMPFHHPRWKQRVPRDRGASWDFEDTRDHYVQRLFGLDPRELRYGDLERYLAVSSAAVGEAMLATFAEWRSRDSSCRGGLVFWLKDYWPGAGWGVIDALGVPKSAYYYLARAFAPLALLPTDEGLNGLLLHAVNDHPNALDAELTLSLYRAGESLIEEHKQALSLPKQSVTALAAEALIGRFVDSTYAYRFGPPNHDLVVATLKSERGEAHAFHLPNGYARARELDLGLSAQAQTRDGKPGLLVRTHRFAQSVQLDVPGFRARDDWFHLEPNGERWVELRPLAGAPAQPRGSVAALNSLTRPAIR